ncbi:uncharacterized protein FIBRA_04018 [Fibroporia radiculosa]|uniref:Elongator complex protein 5 n=1 Tax=Fibroporia radiculosa TaxID=599839 RepID=J4GNV7_9APHY|nr:uncharacterized protein FIBRA_04018 [Fibroporia radiculosa]CCM01945.1 predicted protein [Fibroporia radiculosa]
MPPLLASTLTKSTQRLLLLQSSTAQSCLPIIRRLVTETRSNLSHPGSTLLFCLLYPPSAFAGAAQLGSECLRTFDWTGNVPGYTLGCTITPPDIREEIRAAVRSAPPGPVVVIVDSVDTLFSDLGSLAKTEQFLSEIFGLVCSRSGSRLVLHVLAPSPLIPILTQTRFSPALTHIIAHPPALLSHLATAYLTPPPPLSTPEKFWRVFLPIADRHYESEKLVFTSDGEGPGSAEFAVELLVRGADGSARRKGVEHVLEGWIDSHNSSGGCPCDLQDLDDLKGLWKRNTIEEIVPDPTQNLPFNLNLTAQQQLSRAQVPLPYEHNGTSKDKGVDVTPAAILYDPDSADDIDDDDPDEDLDI